MTATSTRGTTSGAHADGTGRKVKGQQKADLAWNGLSAASIDVYRNGAKVMTTANDGAATDPINKKGAGSYTYRVCAAGTTTCTNTAQVTFYDHVSGSRLRPALALPVPDQNRLQHVGDSLGRPAVPERRHRRCDAPALDPCHAAAIARGRCRPAGWCRA